MEQHNIARPSGASARPEQGGGAASLSDQWRYRRHSTKTCLNTEQIHAGQAAETSPNRVCKRELNGWLDARH